MPAKSGRYRMQMNDDLRAMARHRNGYGCWSAPYWFLGLEEGMDRGESVDRSERIAAWRYFGSRELAYCQEFHDRIFAFIKKKRTPSSSGLGEN
jgi:hypothetical protein